MTTDLEEATRPRPREDGTFDLTIPDGWQMGRGTFGGLVVASLVRAAETAEGDSVRTLRSFSAEIPGPAVAGDARISVEKLRVGSGQSTIAARLVQNGEVMTFGVALLARSRAASADEWNELTPPSIADWRSMDAIRTRDFGAPVFTQNFEFRTAGPMPFSEGPEALALGWVRAKKVGRAMTTGSYLASMIDVWWPAAFTRATSPRPTATVSYTLQIIGAPSDLSPEAPLAYRARTWVQAQGWFVEQRELWSEAGVLLALNQQTFAVIK